MLYPVYESVNKLAAFPVNAFAAAIESSTLHWHNEYEMIGVLKGSIEVRIQSEVFTLHKYDMVLINSNRIHALQSIGGQNCMCMVVQMDASLFGDGEEEIVFHLGSVKGKEKAEHDLLFRRMVNIVYESLKEDRTALFRLRAEVCALIADLFEYTVHDMCFRNRASTGERDFTVMFIDYVRSHLEEEKLLEVSCHEFGVSRKTLDRNIKKNLEMSAKELIDSLRLEKAKELLKNSSKNMGYIIDICGFGSEKSFYRIFREKLGVTPKAFRENGSMEGERGELKGYLDHEISEVRELLKGIMETGYEEMESIQGEISAAGRKNCETDDA